MTELADVVALLRRPEPRCRTLQAMGREWRHHALLHDAFMAATPPGATVFTAVAVKASDEPEREVGEETWRWWSEAPDRLRVEFAVGNETVTAWFRGATWWSWSSSQGARTNESHEDFGHGKGPGEVMVSPGPVADVLDFELLGTLSALARPAYRLRARPLGLDDVGPGSDTNADVTLHALGAGAHEYELVVDAERGFLLRAEARLESRPFKVLELIEVVVDAALPASVFTPEAPEGEQFEYFQAIRTLSLEELPAAVPFKVFVPAGFSRRPAAAVVRNPEPRRGMPFSVMISYVNLSLHESAEPEQAPSLPSEEWSQVDGFTVSADESTGHLRCKVVFERDGTYVRLESFDMALHELIDIARSLVLLSPGRAS
jgi:hypothetical protein